MTEFLNNTSRRSFLGLAGFKRRFNRHNCIGWVWAASAVGNGERRASHVAAVLAG
ncbi:hypothetical protein [Renibacterium salmoninarum]|uniref:hypothetical protein n=1 Tax=Renibacterium salmoninarum TaxID=1646 RepID=UPI0002D32DA4|nr:hypothetical protein [Renibacterium salmoninarum]